MSKGDLTKHELKQYDNFMKESYSKEEVVLCLISCRREKDRHSKKLKTIKESYFKLQGRLAQAKEDIKEILKKNE